MPIETQNRGEKFIPGGNTSSDPEGSGVAIHEHWLKLPDGRMRYLQAGAGPPLILIHGLMGYSFSWRFTIPTLARHATVYAIDNLGAGLSIANEGMDCTLRATAERFLQFAGALGIDDFDLLGTSHGGGIAMMVAALCAEKSVETFADRKTGPGKGKNKDKARLRRLILVAPVNPWSPHGKRFAPFVGSPLGSFIFRNTIERWRSLDYIWLRRLFEDASKIPTDSLEGYRVPVFKNHVFRHASHILRNWTTDLAELEKALPKIRDYPTLLIWGTKDRAVAFHSAEPLRRNFRDSRLVAFEGVGHLPYEEAPNDFNCALVEFLTDSQFPVLSSQFSAKRGN